MTRPILVITALGHEVLRVPLLASGLVFGRSQRCDVVVRDDEELGRRQFRVVARDDRWWVEDLGATNRTMVAGVPLAEGAQTELTPGGVIEVGLTRFTLARDDRFAPPSAGHAANTVVMPRAGPDVPFSPSDVGKTEVLPRLEAVPPWAGVPIDAGPQGQPGGATPRRRPADGRSGDRARTRTRAGIALLLLLGLLAAAALVLALGVTRPGFD